MFKIQKHKKLTVFRLAFDFQIFWILSFVKTNVYKNYVSPVLIDRISEKPCFYGKMNCMIRILHAVGKTKKENTGCIFRPNPSKFDAWYNFGFIIYLKGCFCISYVHQKCRTIDDYSWIFRLRIRDWINGIGTIFDAVKFKYDIV